MKKRILNSFTILELMVTVSIIGAISMFAIPNFLRAVDRAHIQDAVNQLIAIYSANQIYRAQTLHFWPNTQGGADFAIGDINTNLHLNIIPNGMTYTCSPIAYAPPATTFACQALSTGGSFTVHVTNIAVETDFPHTDGTENPHCHGASCPP